MHFNNFYLSLFWFLFFYFLIIEHTFFLYQLPFISRTNEILEQGVEMWMKNYFNTFLKAKTIRFKYTYTLNNCHPSIRKYAWVRGWYQLWILSWISQVCIVKWCHHSCVCNNVVIIAKQFFYRHQIISIVCPTKMSDGEKILKEL